VPCSKLLSRSGSGEDEITHWLGHQHRFVGEGHAIHP
jgi:hypothetical protein